MARQVRVLIVDDDLDSLYYVDDLLSELGYYPIKATSAADAAEIIGAMYVDAVIIALDLIATAPESALERFTRARDYTPTLIMGRHRPGPDGVTSPLRCFVERPPTKEELQAALEQCVTAPVRAGR
jgi:DNA-binding NtrC family response regulator